MNYMQVVVGLWAASVIGSWCNFLTVLYVGNDFCFLTMINYTFYVHFCKLSKYHSNLFENWKNPINHQSPIYFKSLIPFPPFLSLQMHKEENMTKLGNFLRKCDDLVLSRDRPEYPAFNIFNTSFICNFNISEYCFVCRFC